MRGPRKQAASWPPHLVGVVARRGDALAAREVEVVVHPAHQTVCHLGQKPCRHAVRPGILHVDNAACGAATRARRASAERSGQSCSPGRDALLLLCWLAQGTHTEGEVGQQLLGPPPQPPRRTVGVDDVLVHGFVVQHLRTASKGGQHRKEAHLCPPLRGCAASERHAAHLCLAQDGEVAEGWRLPELVRVLEHNHVRVHDQHVVPQPHRARQGAPPASVPPTHACTQRPRLHNLNPPALCALKHCSTCSVPAWASACGIT